MKLMIAISEHLILLIHIFIKVFDYAVHYQGNIFICQVNLSFPIFKVQFSLNPFFITEKRIHILSHS